MSNKPQYKITIYEAIRLLVLLVMASIAFGSAFQKIEANSQDIDLLKAYYKDVSSSLNSISNSVSRMEGKVELIVKKVY